MSNLIQQQRVPAGQFNPIILKSTKAIALFTKTTTSYLRSIRTLTKQNNTRSHSVGVHHGAYFCFCLVALIVAPGYSRL